MSYVCRYFTIEELVPRSVYRDRSQKAWELLDTNMLKVIDRLRDKFGSMTINSWRWGGDREWSGLRTPDSPYFSLYSQHSFGRAFDIIFNDITVEEVREYILDNPEEFPEIGGVELDTSWLHIDGRNYTGIKRFTP